MFSDAQLYKIYDANQEWDWFPMSVWPYAIQNCFLADRMSNSDRFKTFVFFTGNGMSTDHAKHRICKYHRCDKDAVRQLEWLTKLYETGNPSKYTYFDVMVRKSQRWS